MDQGDPEDLENLGCLECRERLESPVNQAALGDPSDPECLLIRWGPVDLARLEALECRDHLAALDYLAVQAIQVILLSSLSVVFPTIQME